MQEHTCLRRTVATTMMVLLIGFNPAFAQDTTSSASGQPYNEQHEAPEPKETTETSSKTWLIVGGVAAVGLVAAAAGSGGGGGSDSSTAIASVATDSASDANDNDGTDTEEEEQQAAPFTGPDLEGDSWRGYVNLVNYGHDNVSISAKVYQDGDQLQITTSSPLPYARLFTGKISATGYITVHDLQTNKIWTSFNGVASANHFFLYDYVNNGTDLDKIELSR